MRHRTLTGYAVGTALVLAVILAVRGRVATRVGRTRTEITEAARLLTAEPDSVESRVGYHRFRARRDAVAAMQTYLLRVVAAESASLADSGRLMTIVLEGQTKGTEYNDNLFHFHTWTSWWAISHNWGVRITCWVYVGPDTTISHSPSGKPACAGDAAVPPEIMKPFRSAARSPIPGWLNRRLQTS